MQGLVCLFIGVCIQYQPVSGREIPRHAEWIRTTAQIPIHEYEKFVQQFDPEKFNAEEWVKLAKAAGMKYIVITSKHHDGFCMFDTKQTDFDIMSTPFHRDVMKELAAACKKKVFSFAFIILSWTGIILIICQEENGKKTGQLPEPTLTTMFRT